MNWRDILSRAAWTFAQTFLAVLLADQTNFFSLDAAKTAAIAALAAVLSLIKTIAAQQIAPMQETPR